jgi:3-oxoisoapionate decarboxylase
MQPAVRTTMGFTPDSFVIRRPPRTAIEFMEYAYSVGGGGVQATLASFEPDYLKKVRAKGEELGMYWEVLAPLPGEDTAKFEQTIVAAKEAGAGCMRTACLSGRRYETFDSLEKWQAFVTDSKAKLGRAAKIADKHRFPVGIENHKDWTIEEMVPLLKSYNSEYLGACIDFGNSISLLDDPREVIEALAPFVVNTHIKDAAVEQYADGFLLSEVPMGTGIVDLKWAVGLLKQKKPTIKFSLDMLVRDPLKVPCLTGKYWVTFPDRNGIYLARTLRMVQEYKPKRPLPHVTGLDKDAQLKLESEIISECVLYARDQLNLRA